MHTTIKLPTQKEVSIDFEEAFGFITNYLRRGGSSANNHFATYGYELYLDTVLIEYLNDVHKIDRNTAQVHQKTRSEASPPFLDACWDLCRRGILRPYPKNLGEGSTRPGFSLTEFGEQWLKESHEDDFLPTELGRFSQMLKPFTKYFGEAFQERSQEAIRCYNAHAYIACCAMAGSAAETILRKLASKLEVSVAEKDNITQVREKIISNSKSGIKAEMLSHSDIIKYWRDSGMHHESWKIDANEAYVSLAMLLKFCMFIENNWYKKSEDSDLV